MFICIEVKMPFAMYGNPVAKMSTIDCDGGNRGAGTNVSESKLRPVMRPLHILFLQGHVIREEKRKKDTTREACGAYCFDFFLPVPCRGSFKHSTLKCT
jgi:hypothetical protein